MATPVILTGKAANLMLYIWHASGHEVTGIPVPVTDRKSASQLEKAGMVELHHLGSGVGATATARGALFVRDSVKHFAKGE